MYEIKVIDDFSGAHNLREYKGKCEALHGHNWKVEVSLSGDTLNKHGMIMDFTDLKESLKKVLSSLDHKYLNDLAFFKQSNPTSENIARFIYGELAGNVPSKGMKVTVWETESSSATFEE
ncbi:6-carboxytetrahydropterin synthase QueD [Candidatus Omnitrophota bacterium]